MEFRWVSLIALWTLLSGPAFNLPDASHQSSNSDRSGSVIEAQEKNPAPSAT